MDGGGDFFLGSHDENRYAIGGENGEKNIALAGEHSIRLPRLLKCSIAYFDDVVPMHLPHRHHPPVVNAHGKLHVADILTDHLGIVADPVRGVQSRISPDAFSTLPPHKTVQQSGIFLPLGNLKLGYLHKTQSMLAQMSMQPAPARLMAEFSPISTLALDDGLSRFPDNRFGLLLNNR